MKHRFTLAAAALVAGLTLAGCGTATDVSGSSASATVLTKQSFGASMARAAQQATSVHVDGVINSSGQTIRLSADQAMSHSASIKDATAAMSLSMAGQQQVQMRLVGGSLYVDAGSLGIPGLSSDPTKPWISLDLTDTSNPMGDTLRGLGSAVDAGRLGSMFQRISTLQDRGPANIDGIQTRHYRVVVPTAKLAGLLGMPSAMGMASQLPKVVAYDVWIDAQGRPFQISAHVAGMSMTMSFSHWNEPLHVVAPPASQVRPFSL